MSQAADQETYESARATFLAAAEQAGLRCARVRVPHENVSDLYIDFALLQRDPSRVLVHLSGVHGIEGYCGSAVQTAILHSLPAESGSSPSLLFVHAVNPYGMALYRRANGENVDLNRNYTKQPCENPDYRFFNPYLNPRSKLQFLSGSFSGLLHYKRLGAARSAQAIASGQSEFPGGLFFSGRQVQREITLLQNFLRAHCSGAKEAIVIDVHTGLGPFGSELLFVDADISPTSPDYFARVFGRPVNLPDPAAGTYENHGRLSGSLRAALPQTQLRYALQEFGTRSARTALNALRWENFAWQARPAGTLPPPAIRQQMLHAFYPAEPDWRTNTIKLGVERWKQAHKALDSTNQG